MPAISLRLPDDIETRLAEEARLEGCPRSEVIREAIAQYLARREQERFMTEMVAEARQGYGEPKIRKEALEMTEESSEAANDALDIAERRKPGEPWPEELGEKWWH